MIDLVCGVFACAHTNAYVSFVHVCMFVCLLRLYLYMRVCMREPVHVCVYVYMYVHVCICVHCVFAIRNNKII